MSSLARSTLARSSSQCTEPTPSDHVINTTPTTSRRTLMRSSSMMDGRNENSPRRCFDLRL